MRLPFSLCLRYSENFMFSYSTQLLWMFLTVNPSYSVSVSLLKSAKYEWYFGNRFFQSLSSDLEKNGALNYHNVTVENKEMYG